MSRRSRRADRIFAWIVALAAHALVFVLVLQAFPRPLQTFEPRAISVELVQPPPPPTPPTPPTPKPPRPRPIPRPTPKSKPAPSPRPTRARSPAPPRPLARPIHVAVRARAPDALPASLSPPVPAPTELSAAEVAGAITAGDGSGPRSGSGGSGGACDMVRRLQDALRRDPRVIEAVEQAHRAAGGRGAAILVWNGDWVRSGDEAGKGLASVRQAISVDVAFAPEACRAAPVNGLVLISLRDGPGLAKLAIGAPRWRWTDLLFSR